MIAAVDQPDLPLTHVFGAAQYAISRSDLYTAPPSEASRDRIDAAIETRGWTVTSDAPARVGAANVLDAFEEIGHPELTLMLEDYLTAAESVAHADLEAVGRQRDIAAMAETVVAGTVLGDALFAALRRLAQEHVTFELYGIDHESDPFGRATLSAADD